jgi:type II secretory pathway pseudopilin PulG
MELLIVLAVILVVVSLTLPALHRPFAKSKLLDAAKQLRVALARARMEAIESGSPQQFLYQPGTGLFEISARSTSEGGSFTPVASEGTEEALATEDFGYSAAAQYALPEGVRFFDPLAPEALPDEAEPVASGSDGSWSAPILFYPNGRTFNALVRLHGDYNYYVDVTLRGLTGACRVGQVQRLEQTAEEDELVEPSLEQSP